MDRRKHGMYCDACLDAGMSSVNSMGGRGDAACSAGPGWGKQPAYVGSQNGATAPVEARHERCTVCLHP